MGYEFYSFELFFFYTFQTNKYPWLEKSSPLGILEENKCCSMEE